MKRHVEIAGAGFAGMAVATALCQRGWTARVHESSDELRAFGAGIFLWENGLRVLGSLGAREAVLAGCHEAPGYEARDGQNRRMAIERFGLDRGTRMVTMTRQHLYSAMLGAAQRAGVEFRTRSEVVSADPAGALATADGRTWKADLVVGADGVKSNVRRSLGLQPKWTKYAFGVTRLLVSRAPDDTPGTDPDNVINFWTDEHRILYVPCNPRETYLALAARDDDKASTAIPVPVDIWTRAFPFLASMLSRIGREGRYDTYETNVLPKWSVGRAVLVGDSAHSMPPTLGQGAGCALMNALGLAVALEAVDEEHGGDVEAALARWEARERPLTDHTQRIASEYAQTRAGSGTQSKWDEAALRAARHVPSGALA